MGDLLGDLATYILMSTQGNILGSTLFPILWNTWRDVVCITQKRLREVIDWLKHNLLTLNITKTKYIAFRISKRTASDSLIRIKFYTTRQADILKHVNAQIYNKFKILNI